MSKRESEQYQRFKRALESSFDLHRIENLVNSGTFDVVLSRNDRSIWVELKRDFQQCLRPSQLRWGMNRQKAGCYNDMWIVYPGSDDDWVILKFTEVLQARGILRDVEVRLPALTGGAMRVFFEGVVDGTIGHTWHY